MNEQTLQYFVSSQDRASGREDSDRLRWAILNGDYDRKGGVSDYTRQVAAALAAAGDEVTVCAPLEHHGQTGNADYRLTEIRRKFGVLSLRDLDRALTSIRPDRVLIQYVPQGYGWHGMNLSFCLWLFAHRRRYHIWVMFHEVAVVMDRRKPFRHNALAIVTQLMAALAARSATQIFVSIPAWEKWLRSLRCPQPITWLPVPANIPVIGDLDAIAKVKGSYTQDGKLLVGHLGMYGTHIPETRIALLSLILQGRGLILLLLGHGSQILRERLIAAQPGLAAFIHATGTLSPGDLSNQLSACDLMVQPYPDGISTRRTSAMACLSHALPVITTAGHLTEPLWRDGGAVLLSPVDNPEHLAGQTRWLLNDAAERSRLSAAGKALYEDRFALSHTIDALRLTTGTNFQVSCEI
jgi:glycosyltransferase involved in cell wall biosynthesis